MAYKTKSKSKKLLPTIVAVIFALIGILGLIGLALPAFIQKATVTFLGITGEATYTVSPFSSFIFGAESITVSGVVKVGESVTNSDPTVVNSTVESCTGLIIAVVLIIVGFLATLLRKVNRFISLFGGLCFIVGGVLFFFSAQLAGVNPDDYAGEVNNSLVNAKTAVSLAAGPLLAGVLPVVGGLGAIGSSFIK